MNIFALLRDQRLITEAQASQFETEAKATGHSEEEVLEKNGITLEGVLKAKGDYYKIPVRDLKDGAVPFEVLRYIPEESATHYRFVPLGVADGVLEVGIVDPDNIEARDALNF